MTKPCAWIENMISFETDGWSRPCCGESDQLTRIANVKNGIVNAFNDSKLLELRKNLLDTGFSNLTDYACRRCRVLENLGQESLRNKTSFLTNERQLKVIQFKLSNRCQLTCAHCGPNLSTGWKKYLNIKPIVEQINVDEKLLNELSILLPSLSCIKFTGGEPFLDPNHWKILNFLKSYDKSNCELIYITNGLVKPNIDLWKGWKKINCSISIDGFKETYEWFRRSASWHELIENVNYLKEHSNVKINYSITPWTANDFTKTKNFFNWAEISWSPVVFPPRSSITEFPKNIAEKYFINKEFINLTSRTSNLTLYKQFAKEWDIKWHTVGLSEKLFPWLNEIS